MRVIVAIAAFAWMAMALASPTGASIRQAAVMSAPRAAHTATTLADGSVLIVGGFAGEEHRLSGIELYEPRQNRFVTIGKEMPSRQSHTASVLPGGRVLIAGGYGANTGCLDTTEIFDLATRSLQPAARLSEPRCEHTAIALSDGRIALIGGRSEDWTVLDTIEIFDPQQGSFEIAGRMSVPRTSNVSILLPDGRIFVAGGSTGRGATLRIHASSEIFDPHSGRSIPTAPMSVPRFKHDGVALADGRVLITGGSSEDGVRPMLASAEIYEPSRDAFVPAVRMNEPRYKHRGSSLLLDSGKVLISGGARQPELYDPRADAFTLVNGVALLQGRFSAVAMLNDRRVLIAGGYHRPDSPSPDVWLYEPAR
jgi:hypothetical protein